jgi:hypothetical protein
MKAILIKTVDGYYINTEEPLNGIDLACYPWSIDKQKLSKQNCDKIFEVVDVEKLSEKFVGLMNKNTIKGYKAGFNKAMELNKDKLFTLEDMVNCWNKALKFQEHRQTLGEFIQSLQQPTEIEVTYNPDEKDSDGCLILKKI